MEKKIHSESINLSVVDMHVHLRDEPRFHLQILAESGYSEVLAMANTSQILDNKKKIDQYLARCRETTVKVNLVSALSKGLRGEELVNIRELRSSVAGFSDDGKCLKNLKLLEAAFNENILITAHLEPETEMLEKYITILRKSGRGRLHCQHISLASSVGILRQAKRQGLHVTAETGPQYLYLDKTIEDIRINPELGDNDDRLSLLEGLQDGTIDCIASDYAPLPRKTGFASARMFIPLCQGLVASGILTHGQLKEKIYLNPHKIIHNNELGD